MLTAPNRMVEIEPAKPIDQLIAENARLLSSQLHILRSRLFPPSSQKQMRRFTSGEVARLIGVTDGYLRQIALAGEGPEPEKGSGGRRLYTLQQINDLRRYLAKSKPDYVPWRRPGEHLQVVAMTNFKGGSGKTTASAALSTYLALRGYRVLVIDLDPQASLSTLLGYQPELDLSDGDTLYGAIRYEDRQPLSKIIRPTYIDNLSIVPGNLELHEFEHDTPRVLARGGNRDMPVFGRVSQAINSVADDFDLVLIDCPPQLGFLTLSALSAASGVIVTVHPQMLDVASMSQFLNMTASLLRVVRESGADLRYDFLRYLVTRFEPNDGPQQQIVAFLRANFGSLVLNNAMLKSTAIAEAGLRKQTLYEATRDQFNRQTYERAMDSLEAVNAEIEQNIRRSWGRAAA